LVFSFYAFFGSGLYRFFPFRFQRVLSVSRWISSECSLECDLTIANILAWWITCNPGIETISIVTPFLICTAWERWNVTNFSFFWSSFFLIVFLAVSITPFHEISADALRLASHPSTCAGFLYTVISSFAASIASVSRPSTCHVFCSWTSSILFDRSFKSVWFSTSHNEEEGCKNE